MNVNFPLPRVSYCLLLSGSLSFACGAADDPDTKATMSVPSEGDDDDVVDDVAENGQTGSIGSSACSADSECIEMGRSALEQFDSPGYMIEDFASTGCELVGNAAEAESRFVCACHDDDGGSRYVGLDCGASGRLGECLYPASEFEGCEQEDDSCAAVCADLVERQHQDAAHTYETELRSATCMQGAACLGVVHVADRCFVFNTGSLEGPYDCELDDAAILAAYEQDEAAQQSNDMNTVSVDDSQEEYHPRDADEWQGMLVDISSPIGCEDFCGLALACIDSECLPCASDEDCLDGEGCALDHCVLVDNLECRSRHDCPGDELCLLSGYTGGTARANEDMRAYCLGSSGGSDMTMD
jgi:hypothetical protein